jgi:hypothetical protein
VEALERDQGVKLAPWTPQAGPQTDAIKKAWVPELFYGGARGGGKSDFLLGDFAQDVPTPYGESWHGIIFRQTYKQLEELIKRSQMMYPNWFGPDKVTWKAGDSTWVWANGATLKLRYAESDTDWMEYQGHQYGWIGWDELPTWASAENFLRMKACLRCADPRVPYRRIRASGNPGGPGHQWVKRYFGIDRIPKGMTLVNDPDLPDSRSKRMYIPSKLTDNKILMSADPDYLDRLKELGNPELIRQWVDGDWDGVVGAYFPEFTARKHVVKLAASDIPPDWTRYRAMDWGSARPFAVYWAAVADGTTTLDGQQFPRGALIVYREYYGARKPNEGVRMNADDVGLEIAKMDANDKITDAVIDPAAWSQSGGPSIAERMLTATNGKVMFRHGDNKRIPGWDQVRARLVGDGDAPQLFFTDVCQNLIRTLPALQNDPTKAEDVDTDSEDHAADALRYLCMARPYIAKGRKPRAPAPAGLRLADLFKDRERTIHLNRHRI